MVGEFTLRTCEVVLVETGKPYRSRYAPRLRSWNLAHWSGTPMVQGHVETDKLEAGCRLPGVRGSSLWYWYF